VPKNAQPTAKQALTKMFMVSSPPVVSWGFLLSRMNPKEPNRQNTPARKINKDRLDKVFQKLAVPVQVFQFMCFNGVMIQR
jgi:hypothetical protein